MDPSNIERLAKFFDAKPFYLRDDSLCQDGLGFYDTQEEACRFFNLIKVEWTHIDWQKVSQIKIGGWMVISFLCEACYKHCFPSLLMELIKNNSLLTDLFMENHLNLLNVQKEWELDYYFSLDFNKKN